MFLTHSKDQGASDDYRHPKCISSSLPDFTVEGDGETQYKQIEDNVPDTLSLGRPSLSSHVRWGFCCIVSG